MVDLIHSPYFVFPDGNEKPFFKMKRGDTSHVIIQHPYTGFDPYNKKIHLERFEVDYPKNSLIPDFIKEAEDSVNGA